MLIPCIDLQGGQAVQLVHGRKRELAVADVFGLLEKFKSYPWLHLIDLDAAIGTGDNNALARELCLRARKRYKLKVRVGGGIRTVARAQEIARWGADQIIIGSAAFRDGKIQHALSRVISQKSRPGSHRHRTRYCQRPHRHPRVATADSLCVLKTSCPSSNLFAPPFSALTSTAKAPCPAQTSNGFANFAPLRHIPSSPQAASNPAAKSPPSKKSAWTPP